MKSINRLSQQSSFLLTWKDVPHRSSAQPAAQTCRSWSWWWQRGLPGLSRLRRWPRWTGSGRRGAEARCWTRPPTASHSSSRAGQSLAGSRRKDKQGYGPTTSTTWPVTLSRRPGHPWSYPFQSGLGCCTIHTTHLGQISGSCSQTRRPRRVSSVTWSCFNPAS